MFLGGTSLAAHLLHPLLLPELDPLGEAAPLLLMTGPLTGTVGPAVGRAVLCAKSPATNLWGESNIGGFLGSELRAAGYDGLWITGRAQEPVYLWLHDEKVELRPARHLWGQADTYETQSRIRAETGDRLTRVAAIGLAGENELPFALVLCDHGRVAGRTGMGAVMGAKKLKAIAMRGRREIPLALPEAFARSRRRINIDLRDDNLSRSMRVAGTSSGTDYFEYLGEMPQRYFTAGVFEGTSRLSGAEMAETILHGVSACHGCVIACGRVVRLEDGKDRKGPEYETIIGFGPNLWIDDLPTITRLGEWCDRYGLDTISTSNVIGLAFLLSERGILSEADTGGRSLRWGDAGAAEGLIHEIARREGFGALLSEGARALAIRFGVPHLAAEVRNLEVPYHDPRGSSGMALVYATSPRGACHNQSDFFMVDTSGQTVEEIGLGMMDRFAGAEKAANVARHQDWRTVFSSLVMCQFSNLDATTILELVNQATGFEYTLRELVEVGERGWNLKRLINFRLGSTREDDRLPPILLTPLPEGGAAGYVPDLQAMLERYYAARGWDATDGMPTRECLRRLRIEGYQGDPVARGSAEGDSPAAARPR
jgi:aldehyde:ferredoxin oxidoreductase